MPTPRAIRQLDNSLALSDAMCEVIVQHHRGDAFDLARTMVLVPGGRLARAIDRGLLARARAAGQPLLAPSIVTPLMLAGRFVVPDRPVLSRLGSRLAWRAALDAVLAAGDADARAVARLLHGKDELPQRVRARTALRLERLGSEIASAMHDVRSVAAGLAAQPASRARNGAGNLAESIGARLATLAVVADRRDAMLEQAGVHDRDAAIRDAVRAGRLACDGFDRIVVLFADPEPVQRALLAALGDSGVRVEVCVHSAEDVDAEGFPQPSRWEQRPFPTSLVADRQIVLGESPADAADAVVTLIRALPAPRASDDIAVMAPDDETARALSRALELAGSSAARSEARMFSATRLGTMLALLSPLVGAREMEAFAAFVRHPDVARTLGFDEPAHSPDGTIAQYRAETIAERWDDPVPRDGAGESSAVAARFARVQGRVRDAVAPLVGGAPAAAGARPAPEWARDIRAVVRALIGDNTDGGFASERARSVRAFDRALADLADLPAACAPVLAAAEVIDQLVEALRRDEVRGDGADAGVSVLRWLDAGIADERHLILAGFTDGSVPEGAVADPIVGDAERRALGMQSGLRRAARDAWILDGLVARARARAGASISFVVPRRSAQGEPLRPSRFLLRVERDELAGRVARLFPSDREAAAGDDALPAAGASPLAVTPVLAPATYSSISVTAFRTYLECPYLFQLRNDPRLRLRYDDEAARELAPNAFGTLLHDAAERWGRAEAAACRREESAARIFKELSAHLDGAVREKFPTSRGAAVRVQVELIRKRLERLAALQAEQAKLGWRVRAVEVVFAHQPGAGEFAAPLLRVPGAADGQRGLYLVGRIDRVDVHDADGIWRALDYKSSKDGKSPTAEHRRGKRTKVKPAAGAPGAAKTVPGPWDGEWINLQLPLYRTLLKSLPAAAPGASFGGPVDVHPSALGYINLGPNDEHSEFAFLDCTPDEVEEAENLARGIVAKILAGEFAPNPKPAVSDHDPFAPIWGLGMRVAAVASGGDA